MGPLNFFSTFYQTTKFKSCPNSKRDNLNVTKTAKFVFDRIENNVGKGENADYQHFLLFLQCFQKLSFFRVVKSRECFVKN